MKEKPESLAPLSAPAEAPPSKPDTSHNLTRYEIWYQDAARTQLWHSRSGAVLDVEAGQNYYHDVLQVLQIVFPLNVSRL